MLRPKLALMVHLDLYLVQTIHLMSIDTTHNNQQLVVSKGITINGGEILLNKASAGTTINMRNNEMKSLTFNAESGISDIMTIDTRAGLEEIRMLKSDITTLLATTINASSLTTLNGGLEMDNNKFTVEDETGNTFIGGTLNIAGVLTSQKKAHLNGGLQMDGNKFVVEDGTGNTNIEGSLTVEQLTTFKGSIDLSSPIDSSSEIIIEDQKNVSLTFKTDTGVDLVTLNTNETFPEVNVAGQLASRDDYSAGTLRGGQLNMERAGIKRSNPAMVETISHGLATDDTIIIDGLIGMEDLNGGVYTVDSIDSSNFQLRESILN